MALDPVTAGIELVSKVIGKTADRFLPAALSEAEREEFKLKARELALKELEAEARAMESVNATIREEVKSEHWMQWSWRPLIGYTFAAVIINNYVFLPYLKILGLLPIDIPSGIWEAMLIVLGVSAGTRGLEKWQREKR